MVSTISVVVQSSTVDKTLQRKVSNSWQIQDFLMFKTLRQSSLTMQLIKPMILDAYDSIVITLFRPKLRSWPISQGMDHMQITEYLSETQQELSEFYSFCSTES
ncbi:hypothetical protein Tco_1547968 [Tanacetum coccineum]